MADWQNFPQGQAALKTLIAGISKTPFYWHEYSGQDHGQLTGVQGVVRDGEHAGVLQRPSRGVHLRELDLDGAARVSLGGVRDLLCDFGFLLGRPASGDDRDRDAHRALNVSSRGSTGSG